eukprot:Gb_29971 [translate_table: standard]
MHSPEEIIILHPRNSRLINQLQTEILDIILDNLRQFSAQFEDNAFLRQPAVDRLISAGQELLDGRVEFEGGFLGGRRVGAQYHGAGTVAEECGSDKVIWAVGIGWAVADDGGLRGCQKNAAAGIVLGELFSDAQAGDAAGAAEEVEQNSAHVVPQAKFLGHVHVPSRQSKIAGRHVDQVRYLRRRPSPFLYALGRRFDRHVCDRLV